MANPTAQVNMLGGGTVMSVPVQNWFGPISSGSQATTPTPMPLNPGGLVTGQAAVPITTQHNNFGQWLQNWMNSVRGWEQQGGFWGNWWGHPATHVPAPTPTPVVNVPHNMMVPAIPAAATPPSQPAMGTMTINLGSEDSPETPGMGQYIPTSSYMMSPAGAAGIRGLGDCGCGCNDCGGMGTLGDGTGLMNTGLFNGQGVMGSGLFEGGMDPSTWGPAEWAAMVVLGYVAYSVFFTTKSGIGYAQTVPARTRRAARGVKSSFL